MFKKFITAAALVTITTSAFSQTIVEGTISDKKTGEPMPFVNIAVVGTTTGTISDINGEFKLSVPESMTSKDLAFSSVGYSMQKFKVSAVADTHLEIKMEPVNLEIEEVVVTDKSEAGRKVLKDVLSKYTDNYVSTDYAYAGTYKSVYRKGSTTRTATYNFNAYDSEGYTRSDNQNAFAALNYKFGTISRDFKVNDYETGINHFDLVSSLDIMRYELGVMNSYTFSDFDFKIKSETADQYVVEFNCNKPKVTNTGALKTQKYSGTITISKADKAVIATDYTLEVKDFSTLGLSLKTDENNTATITCKTTYAKLSGKYSVKTISSTIDVKGSENYTLEDNITLNSANYKVPGKISGKVFYTR